MRHVRELWCDRQSVCGAVAGSRWPMAGGRWHVADVVGSLRRTLSVDPVASRCSLMGLKAMQLMLSSCASATFCSGSSCLESQMNMQRSSPTLPKRLGSRMCQATSSTTAVCKVLVCLASIRSPEAASTLHRHTLPSSEPLSSSPVFCGLGFHARP
eukprot:scaffold1596_cov302-Pinguiococcus_pyrenoidosus.AAC.85